MKLILLSRGVHKNNPSWVGFIGKLGKVGSIHCKD